LADVKIEEMRVRILPLMVGWMCGLSMAAGGAAWGQQYTAQRKAVVEEAVNPVQVVKREDGVFFVDFGKAAFGRLELEMPGVKGGEKITVRMGEMMSEAEHIKASPGGSVRFWENVVTTEEGKTAYRVELPRNDARLMPAEVGGVMPFRYVELAGMPADMTAENLGKSVHQVAVHYPFEEGAAEFACSDKKINAIWDLCKYSMKATSYGGVFVDGDRERKPYEADAYINQLGWYYTTTDTTLPRYSHEYLIRHPTWPTEWIMFSVLMGWEDYRYTGDAASLKTFYEELKAKTLRGLERPDGLISTVQPPVPAGVKAAIHFSGTLKDIVDWPEGERDGYEMRSVNTVVNAFHCRALALMAQIAEAVEKPEEAAEFRRAAEKTTAALNAKLLDGATGLYVDGEGSKHCSLHANMFPLAFGLVPAEKREKVAAFVQSKGMACSVYGAQFLMEALCDNGRVGEAMKLMEASGDRSWRHMVEDVGTTITLEAWDNKYKPNQDWNHAWGAAPANILPRKVLGVEPLEPGYKKALIWPRVTAGGERGDVSWARGKVPTVKGAIIVDWQRDAAGFYVAVELPRGMPAEVWMPKVWGERIVVDGKAVTGRVEEGAVVVEVVGGKRHELGVGR
jgi:hypothetical protein